MDFSWTFAYFVHDSLFSLFPFSEEGGGDGGRKEDMGGKTIYLKALAVIPMWPMQPRCIHPLHFGMFFPRSRTRARERQRFLLSLRWQTNLHAAYSYEFS